MDANTYARAVAARLGTAVELDPKARQLAELPLGEMARHWYGEQAPPPDDDREMLRRALAGDLPIAQRAVNSTFAEVVAEGMTMAVSESFRRARPSSAAWVRPKPVSRLKGRLAAVEIGKGAEVGPGKPYPVASVDGTSNPYHVKKSGEIVFVDEDTILGDDIDALGSIARTFSGEAAAIEDDAVYARITGNGTTPDGIALFHTSHSNRLTGSALTHTNYATAVKTLRLQKTADKKRLRLRAGVLMVPCELEETAYALFDGRPDNDPGRPIVVSEPRLSEHSSTNWYVVADPAQVDSVCLLYLTGQREPNVRSEPAPFRRDGLAIRLRHAVDAEVVEWRAILRSEA